MDAVSQNAGIIAQAFWLTLKLFVISGLGALVIGVVLAGMRVSPVAPLRLASRLYVQVVRNTPLTLILLTANFGLPEVGIVLDFFTFAVSRTSVSGVFRTTWT